MEISAHKEQKKTFLTRAESAEYLTAQGLPTPKGTLQKLASVGGGPRYQIWGNRVLYKPSDLMDWAASRLSEPRFSTSA